MRLANEFDRGLSNAGLSPNKRKSSTLAITVDGGNKRWYCNSSQFIMLNGQNIPVMKVMKVMKIYQSIVTWESRWKHETSNQMLNGGWNFGCSSLPKVPFKPQHSLFLLRVHLLPSLYHQLILDKVTPNVLVWLDQMVQKAVRGWLCLSHDLPKPRIMPERPTKSGHTDALHPHAYS